MAAAALAMPAQPAVIAGSLVAVGALVTPSMAQAQSQSKPVALYIEGPDADSVREEVLATFPTGLKVVEEKRFSDALKKAGQKGQMGNVIAQAKQREKLVGRIRKAVEGVDAAGAVIGRVRKTRTGGRELWVLFVPAASGEVSLDEAVPLGKSSDDRKGALKTALEPTLKPLTPQEEAMKPTGEGTAEGETPKDGEDGSEEGDDSSSSGEERTAHAAGTSIFFVNASFQLGGRFFSYSDPITANLRPYDLFGAPMLYVAAEVYPAGLAGDIFIAKDIGITASYTRAFGIDSATEGGDPVATSWSRLNVGLRGRIRPTGDAEGPVVGINAGFGMLDFAVDATGRIDKEVPDVAYRLLRFGLDTRIPVSAIRLELGGDFLLPLSNGEVYDRFREASVLGIEARMAVAVPIAAGFEVRLAGEYTRFFSAFGPVPGDEYIAGGALDQLIGLRLGAGYAY